MNKAKKIICVSFLSMLLLFNIFGVYTSFEENYIKKEIVEKEVTIIDKYEILNSSEYSDSYSKYMKGIDVNDELVIIPGDSAAIGDRIIVYQNKNSAEANGSDPKWHTSIKAVEGTSIFGMILFGFFTIINLCILVHYIKKPIIKQTQGERI